MHEERLEALGLGLQRGQGVAAVAASLWAGGHPGRGGGGVHIFMG